MLESRHNNISVLISLHQGLEKIILSIVLVMLYRNENVVASTFFHIKHFTLDYFVFLFFPYISSSSSYRAGSTDIADPLSPLLPIVHRPR